MMNRREALARLGSFMAAGWLGSKATAATAQTTATLNATQVAAAATTGQPLTIAHITDVHITNRYQSEKWVAHALKMINEHPSKPSLIINTGDCVMDTLKRDKKESLAQWDLWNKTFKNENSLPVHTALGNHDVWAGKMPLKRKLEEDPLFGKTMALEKLGQGKSYYSFDLGNWHFIILDSIFQTRTDTHHSWIAKLDDDQMAWLRKDLAATPKDRNIVVSSHVPILQVCSMYGRKPQRDFSYVQPATSMHGDSSALIELFSKHPNVKLCLSGHVHRLDRIQLHNTTYICDGALSSGKWRRENDFSPNGFSITTLNPDGTFDYKYESIGWRPS